MALRSSNYLSVRIKDRSMFKGGNDGLEEFYKYIKEIVENVTPKSFRVLNYEVIETRERGSGGERFAKLSIEIKRG